jgi:predicted TIM-barrel fold metal-dependent hydrolase
VNDVSTIGLVSADSHVNEPRDLWSTNLPTAYRDQAMRGIEQGEDGGWKLIFEGQHVGKTGTSEAERLEVLKPERRFEVMRQEGIVAECIFPTIGLYVWGLDDPDGGRLSCRVYNDWIHDQLASRSPRFCCAGLIPTWTVADALAEVAYVADLGLGALMVPTVAHPDWNHRDWLPFWAAVAETGIPVVMHQGTGHSMLWYRGPGATVANLIATQTIAPRTATMLATSGILARHPDLHVTFVEYNIGWLAWTMQTIDFYTESFRRYPVMGPYLKPPIVPELDERPSFYVQRQIHATFQDDPIGLRMIDVSGAEALMWGSDYPHEEGTYPWSAKTVDRLGELLTEDQARLVFRENAARVFRFDDDVLATPV